MTNVIPLASPRAAASPDPIAQQAAIENALSMALYFMRQPGNSPENVRAATGRANRALTLLKHASAPLTNGRA